MNIDPTTKLVRMPLLTLSIQPKAGEWTPQTSVIAILRQFRALLSSADFNYAYQHMKDYYDSNKGGYVAQARSVV